MFPANAFAPRYFAPRYWPKVGAAPTTAYVIIGAFRALLPNVLIRDAAPGVRARDGRPTVTFTEPTP